MRWAAVLALAAAPGCRGDRGGDPVARSVTDGVKKQLGVQVKSVRCTRDRCEVELEGGATMAVHLHGERDVIWEADEQVRTAVIAAYVKTELVQLGIDAPVDCGSALVPTTGDVVRITCHFGASEAWVDLLPDGGLSLEVVIGAEALRARTEAVDVDQLERQSRALDTDEAQGVAEDDADAGVDAGALDAQ